MPCRRGASGGGGSHRQLARPLHPGADVVVRRVPLHPWTYHLGQGPGVLPARAPRPLHTPLRAHAAEHRPALADAHTLFQ